MYRLFLDDIRSVGMVYPLCTNEDFIIVRDFISFIEVIREKGLPSFISFDNDLGCDSTGKTLPDGYSAVKWLVYESNLDLSNLKFNVHSANPIAKLQIESLLNNYISYLKSS